MDALKLIALDDEDLAVLAGHLQDSVLRVADMVYLPAENRFAAILNRFNWADVVVEPGPKRPRRRAHRRHRCGLRFERVLSAQLQGIDLAAKDAVLNLLTIQFEPSGLQAEAGTEAGVEAGTMPSALGPDGFVTLFFSAGGAIRLHVECIEAELRDLGGAWQARKRPRHADSESAD